MSPGVPVDLLMWHNFTILNECDAMRVWHVESLRFINLPSDPFAQPLRVLCKPFFPSNNWESRPKSYCYSARYCYMLYGAHLTSGGTYCTALPSPRLHTAHTTSESLRNPHHRAETITPAVHRQRTLHCTVPSNDLDTCVLRV